MRTRRIAFRPTRPVGPLVQRLRRVLGCVLPLLAACAGDCSCAEGCGTGAGSEHGASAKVAPAVPSVKPSTAASKAPPAKAVVPPSEGGAGAPAPDALPVEEVLGELVPARALRGMLPGKLSGLPASTPLLDGPKDQGGEPIRSVSRRYRSGDRNLFLEITDTAQAPSMRAHLKQHLQQASGASAQDVGGMPARAEYFAPERASGAVLLVGGRHVVKARLEGATDPNEVLEVLRKMDWSSLASDGAGGAGGH